MRDSDLIRRTQRKAWAATLSQAALAKQAAKHLRQSPRRRRAPCGTAAGPAAIMIVPTLTVTMEAPDWQGRPGSAATAVLVPLRLTSIAI